MFGNGLPLEEAKLVHEPMVKFSGGGGGGNPKNDIFLQFSQNMDGFR